MRSIALLIAIMLLMTSFDRGATPTLDTKPFWTAGLSAEDFVNIQKERLKNSQASIDRMLAVKGKRTIDNTLVPYDQAMVFLDSAGNQSGLMQEVHPDDKFRTSAEKVGQEISAFATSIILNRDIYDALVAMDLAGADDETRFYVEKTLRQFRLAGVDKDEATRKKIKALQDELVLIGQEFGRNIREDKDKVIVDSVAELDGLPQDYIDAHKPGADGKIVLTIDYPDSIPVLTYAKNSELRKRMYFAYNNRAYPQNMAVLDKLAAKRYELANLLGFKTWADFATADKMIKSPTNASEFITKIVAASKDRAKREYDQLLARKRKDFPDAASIDRWETGYYSELVKKENYSFDSQKVRPYFQYKNVKQGLLDITSKLFGVTFKQVRDAPVWHPSVECWEMFEGSKLIGRFYLDMHPRDGKFNHAAEFAVRNGLTDKQIPEATLVCNLPGGDPNDPGLMDYDDLVTFFHEFGHLLHVLFAGNHKWIGTSGLQTEWDFVEAPSQLLEEWTRDPKTVASFARHYKTGEPIPAEYVAQMNRANEFGKGLGVSTQMVYARVSLSVYDREPSVVDTNKLVKEISSQYSPVPFVEGTHMQTAFGHLDGYSAIYYTYMWSLVLAKDMFSQFDKADLLAPAVAMRYRKTVLEPGGSKPADKLVEAFLGRKTDFKAYQDWLNTDTPK
jgi:thimet oligopeptidase